MVVHMKKVSLKALSESLGLSEGTVSRALNDYPDISEHTRQRVKKTALAMGYRPNSTARRLATGNAECIGYVLPWQSSHLSDPYLAELLDGLTEALSTRHWDLMLSVARSAEDELAIITRMVQTGRVNGLVVSRTLIDDPRVALMKKLRIPFITHGRTGQSDDHAWFDVDNFAAFQDAVTHLTGLGHTKIAHIAGPRQFRFAVDRLAGYRQGLKNARLKYTASFVVKSALTLEGGHLAMQKLLALDDIPTAIVCVSDTVALGAMKAIREKGWQPGREISVVGYDGLPLGEHTHPALTTMTQPLQEAGHRIGKMLLAVIDGEDASQHQVLLRATLVRRETDAPPMKARQLITKRASTSKAR